MELVKFMSQAKSDGHSGRVLQIFAFKALKKLIDISVQIYLVSHYNTKNSTSERYNLNKRGNEYDLEIYTVEILNSNSVF